MQVTRQSGNPTRLRSPLSLFIPFLASPKAGRAPCGRSPMTSDKFLGFMTLPHCQYHIHATFFPLVRNWPPPPSLTTDIICEWPLTTSTFPHQPNSHHHRSPEPIFDLCCKHWAFVFVMVGMEMSGKYAPAMANPCPKSSCDDCIFNPGLH